MWERFHRKFRPAFGVLSVVQEDSMTNPRSRRRLRLVAPWLAATVIAAAGAIALTTTSQASAPLRNHAAAINKFVGYAANASLLCNNSAACTSGNAQYRAIAAAEFNQVTHENALKWEATEPSNNNYQFAQADGVIAFAQANSQVVHGHTLVWHSQTPGYVQGLGASAMLAEMREHIAAVVGRYANNPAVQSWDVVNEAIGDGTGALRTSFWFNTLGENYIDEAFRAARAADGNADLCINDYSIENIGQKSNALFALVQRLQQRGVPITCVGFQAHLVLNQIPGDFVQNMQRFANLGLKVRITELDIRIPLPADNTELQQQSNNFATVVNNCRAVSACGGITTWGIDDGSSWLPNSCCGGGNEAAALLWNAQYQQKPAYTGFHNALGGATVTTTTTSRPPTTTTSRPPTTTTSRPPTTTTTTTSGPPGACSATYTLINQWNTGFQGEVRVTNNGTTATSGWTVVLTFANGQRITQVWNGRTTVPASSPVTVINEVYNNVIGAGQSTTFGFLGSWSGTNSAPSLTCSRTP
jgi:endo-1,4-beta-xylanase